jgi:diguanylate cyclase (GGDEF)-like protein
MVVPLMQPHPAHAVVLAADALEAAVRLTLLVAMALYARASVGRARGPALLDAAVAGMAAASLIAAVGLSPAASLDPTPTMTRIWFTVDIAEFGLAAGVLTLAGRLRVNARLCFLLAVLVQAVASALLVHRLRMGELSPGHPTQITWSVAWALLLAAALQPPERDAPSEVRGTASIAVPLVLSLGALGLMVDAAVGHVTLIAVLLAAGAIVAAATRTVLTVREAGALAETQRTWRTDELTGLPNRRTFLEALDNAARGTGDAGSSPFAVLVLDLDEFRDINDTLGHDAGDLVLERVGARLARLGHEPLLVARLGGDEFAALVHRPRQTPGADKPLDLAVRALGAVRRPLAVEGIEMALHASVGIALHPEHSRLPRDLLRLAEVAMYQAKRERTSIVVYRPDSDPHSRERLALVGQLRQAIERDELLVEYQPQLHVATGVVTGMEALVRWQRPDGARLGPGVFLPIAERCGLMPAVTTRVLEAVVAQQAAWLAAGNVHCPAAINLSVSDLRDQRLAGRIAAVLNAAGVPPELLQVEVTEHQLMSDPEGANRVLQRLRRIGVRVALDDFGTGHSSLAYVQGLALDTLKIDRRFVTGMCESDGDATIVRLAVELARAFGLEVVAEGVEDAGVAAALAALGCDVIQGYWVSPPLSARALPGWFREHEPRRWAA